MRFEKIDDLKNVIKGKNVGLLGLGVSNKPLIKFFLEMGANNIFILDNKKYEDVKSQLDEIGFGNDSRVLISSGENQFMDMNECDIAFKSPSMRPDLPELIKAEQDGIIVTSEMEVFLDLCPCKKIGITGSNGKTTTTTLTYTMLKEQGYKCWLGGNIGIPLLSKIEEVKKDDVVVLELSSFQLQTLKNKFDISAITNLSPNHLDKHKNMEEYIWSKQNILRYQDQNGIAVLNYDNELTRECAKICKSKVRFFSTVSENADIYLKNGIIYYNNGSETKQMLDTKEIVMPGMHNIENYMTAIGITYGMVDIATYEKTTKIVKGVEHRIEYVRELKGVKYYNDSIASSPSRTVAGLKSFNQQVILIAGGYDKKVGFEELAEYMVDKVKCLILMGNTAPKILEAYVKECYKRGNSITIPIINVNSLDEAVNTAYNQAEKGDIVLMSPASASFDMFKNFEEKGKIFKELVNNLKG